MLVVNTKLVIFTDIYLQRVLNMTEKESALHSQYIIDGVRCDTTPSELLDECLADSSNIIHPDAEGCADIIDESIDPPVSTFTYDQKRNMEYLEACLAAKNEERTFRMLYPESFTKQRIAIALLDRLWNDGHFRSGDLTLWGQWIWNTRPLGNMAAFHKSAEAVNSYLFDLGIKLNDYAFEESDEESYARFYAWLPEKDAEEEDEEVAFKSSPYESRHPWISEDRKCSDKLLDEPDSWLIYIPFDTCSFRIGGSLLAQTQGRNGGMPPHLNDPDYFIDCYEVVREFIEDGIAIAGATVCDGGIAAAAAGMCEKCGIKISIDGILSSYQENDLTKMLFAEVPGVLLQIRDADYDYLDSQLLLQDVAYYPLGHPCKGVKGLRIEETGKSGVAGILASLLNQASEGED